MSGMIFDPLILVFAYGQKFSTEQVIKLRHCLIRVLLQANPQMISPEETSNTWLQVMPALGEVTAIKDSVNEFTLLSKIILQERSLSRSGADLLRLLLIEQFLRSDPPMLSVDEVPRTSLVVWPATRQDEPGFANLQITRAGTKLMIEAGGDIFVAMPGPADVVLLERMGADANIKPVVRQIHGNDLSSGFFSVFVAPDDFWDVLGMGGENVSKLFGAFLVGKDGVFSGKPIGGGDENNSGEKDGATEDDLKGEDGDALKAISVAAGVGVSPSKKIPKISQKELVNIILNGMSSNDPATNGEESFSPPADGHLIIPDELEPPGIVRLREYLRGRVIGQERAIIEVARAFNLASAGMSRQDRPMLVEFWAGPTGVGKTEMALSLAKFLEERERQILAEAKKIGKPAPFTEKDIVSSPLVTVDCGMFGSALSHGIANLIGSPVGYIGSKGSNESQPPILSADRFPSNRIIVLLFDEFEKAVVDSRDGGVEIIGILMKILDKGELLNNWNQLVRFDRAIVIFTSNIGSAKIMEAADNSGIGFQTGNLRSEHDVRALNERVYAGTKKEYEKIFSPEFRNRIHRFIAFRFLSDEEYRRIILKEFGEIKMLALAQMQINLELAEDTVEWLLSEIHAQEGVRKLRDWMDKEITEPLSRAHSLKWLRVGVTYRVGTRKVAHPNGQVEIKADFAPVKELKP